MQNTNNNLKTVAIVIIIILAIVFGIQFLMKDTENKNTLNSNEVKIDEQVNIDTNTQTEVKKEQDINKIKTEVKASDKNMENKRLMKDFTPVINVPTLEKKDLVVGTGIEAKAGSTVSVHYTGAVAATGEVFQSSKDFGTAPITFALSGVIKGWTDGIPGMKVGGTRRLIIPSSQAYGATPPPSSGIPANANLVFDVELVDVK